MDETGDWRRRHRAMPAASAAPTSMHWAWVSVPKYTRVGSVDGLNRNAISIAEAKAPTTDTTSRLLRARADPRRRNRMMARTTSGHTM